MQFEFQLEADVRKDTDDAFAAIHLQLDRCTSEDIAKTRDLAKVAELPPTAVVLGHASDKIVALVWAQKEFLADDILWQSSGRSRVDQMAATHVRGNSLPSDDELAAWHDTLMEETCRRQNRSELLLTLFQDEVLRQGEEIAKVADQALFLFDGVSLSFIGHKSLYPRDDLEHGEDN